MIAVALATLLGVLALLHVAWACGMRAGWRIVLPEVDGRPAFLPPPAATALVAVGLAAAAAIALARGGVLSLPASPALVRWATIGLGMVFLARAVGEFRLVGLFKRVRGTPFAAWDTWVYTPLCIAMGTAFLSLAASAR